ncbi:hypothetical protein EIP86_004159 [Pleurotus ostreatoroseus]|nr:hypothetical protein EIP86_004159 [Pleurotus ostreatoroseus]
MADPRGAQAPAVLLNRDLHGRRLERLVARSLQQGSKIERNTLDNEMGRSAPFSSLLYQLRPIPHTILPAIRILKLAQPLAVEHEGAARLAVVLEWVQRVVRVSTGRRREPPATAPLPLSRLTKYAALPPRVRDEPGSLWTTSSLSFTSLQMAPAPRVRPSRRCRARGRSSHASGAAPACTRARTCKDDAHSLDGLINFVTTISTAFLTVPLCYSPGKPRNPLSAGESVTSSTLSGAASPSRTHAHIVHVLPGDPHTHASPARTKPNLNERSAPASLLKVVLLRALDARSDPFSPSPTPTDTNPAAHALLHTTPRALLTDTAVVVLLAEDTLTASVVVVRASEPVPSSYTSPSTNSTSTAGYVSASDSSPPSPATSSLPRTPRSVCVRGSPLVKSMGGGGVGRA